MRIFLYMMSIVILFTGCSQLKVDVDYDEAFDFPSQKTFAILTKKVEGSNTLVIDRITDSLEKDLLAKNYKKSSKDSADLIFVFHVDVKSKSDIRSDYQMVGFGRYRYGGGMVAMTHTYDYDEGTLIIDALSPKTKNIVWRGLGQTEVSYKETPKEKREYINSIVTKIMSKFPKSVE